MRWCTSRTESTKSEYCNSRHVREQDTCSDAGRSELVWSTLCATTSSPISRDYARPIDPTASRASPHLTKQACDAQRQADRFADEVLKAINNLVVLLSDRFLVHNSVHRPLRRLLRSCIGEDREEKVHGSARLMGAAGRQADVGDAQDEELQGDLVDLMCALCSRMRAL